MRALSLEGAFIPDPDGYFPRSAVLLYPDAAGGATSDCKKGWGCCYPEKMKYARGSWPAYILKNSVLNGQTWGRRLSILECLRKSERERKIERNFNLLKALVKRSFTFALKIGQFDFWFKFGGQLEILGRG